MSRTLVLGSAAGSMVASPLLLALLALAGESERPDVCEPGQPEAIGGLDAEQTRHAGIITAVGQSAGVSPFGLQVALATAMQESQLRNLPYGDRDSVGLFQQRPSAGWGTPDQLMDPVYAAQAFFGGPTGPNSGEPPGLLDIDGWADMTLAEAAQAVQKSAYPDAYAAWEDEATTWLGDLLAAGGGSCTPGGGLSCPPTGLPAEDGLTPDAQRVLRCIATTFPQISTFHGVGDRPNESDHPSGRAVDAMIPDWVLPAGNELGWQVAEWVQANHVCLGVTYVIWDAQIWSADRASDGWRPYDHPNGWTDANALHQNHVHVSVAGDSGACVDGAWVVPIAGEYVITARFGDTGTRWSTRHTGVDLAAPVGRPVLAAAGGQVTNAGWDGAYGQRVEITHLDGTTTWYAHLSASTVDDGSFVAAGDVIGRVGATGNTSGPHLHYEVRPGGAPIDPEPWMAARGAPL
ncbi:MAG: M23 family metallopeptidase [bacterium]